MFSSTSFLSWAIYRKYFITILIGFWLEIWMVYMGNTLLSGFFVRYIGHYPAHIYRNLIIIPFYLYAAKHYVLTIDDQDFIVRPWITGVTWVSLSIVCDFTIWHFFFKFPMNYLIYQFAFWKGWLYSLELLALLISVPSMDWYVRKYYEYGNPAEMNTYG